jgi:arabinofuranosyltransferase
MALQIKHLFFTTRNWLQENILLVPILLIAVYMVWTNAFLQDDAYISFRYAKWFSRGYGLVWYPGLKEFGYTNFLYTLLIGIFMIPGIPPEIASAFINISTFFVALILTYKLAFYITRLQFVALAATLLLSIHHSFTSYATGGMETMLVTALVLGFYYLLYTHLYKIDAFVYGFIGILASLVMLTRLDSVLLLIPGYVFLWLYYSPNWKMRSLITSLTTIRHAVIPPVIIVPVFILCCYISYGDALPNTFYVKSPESFNFTLGIRYFWYYLIHQFYVPLLVPAIIIYFYVTKDNIQKIDPLAWHSLSIVAIWVFYILFIGGDFMEFRFIVPILPFYFIFIFHLCTKILNRRGILCVLGLFMIANLVHGVPRIQPNSPQNTDLFLHFKVLPIEALSHSLYEKPVNWIDVGKVLHKLFYTGSPNDVLIATTAAGAIAYFSELNTIDQLGLNTRAIRNYGEKFMDIPGHNMRISIKYLQIARVNLVIDHPMYSPNIPICRNYPQFPFHKPLYGVPMLMIPIVPGSYLITYYLTKHPKVERLIKERKIFYCNP